MNSKLSSRALAALLAFVMLVTVLPVAALAETVTYVMDVADIPDVEQYSKADGDTMACGTDNYFTIFFAEKNRIEANEKTFDDGFTAGKRLNFGASTKIEDPITSAIQIKPKGPAKVKVWWVSGGNKRDVAVFDETGNVVAENPVQDGSVKNSLYITEIQLDAAGTYYIGNTGGNNNYYKVEVTEEVTSGSVEPTRAPWADVAAPVISEAKDDGKGHIRVTVDALVGFDGGDEVVVTMFDASGKKLIERNSIMERGSHTIEFTPEGSGSYSFTAELKRAGETGKQTPAAVTSAFSLPLVDPILISGTSKGDGKVALNWTAVQEATTYEILVNGKLVATTDKTSYTVEKLTVGQKYTFQIAAVRGSDRTLSGQLEVTATKEEKVTWGFVHYGPSTNADNNGYVGDLNEDGQVTVYSEGGKGKIQPNSVDGIAFYYTAIPTEYNFTLRAKVTVDSWELSNGQEGFGLLVADRLGTSGDTSNFWNNSYMALASKIEYRYNLDALVANDLNGTGTKYSMKMGLGTLGKTGVTKENLPLFEKNDQNTINTQFLSETYTLETAAGFMELDAGTYNVIGNCTNLPENTISNLVLTEFVLEIQKNNTGYFVSYYDNDGKLLMQHKYYGADSLSKLDSQYVYAGFFAARNARATFSDVKLTKVLASQDAPAEERPVTKLEPTISMSSSSVTTKSDYTIALDTNVSGTVDITVDGKVIVENDPITGLVRYYKDVKFEEHGPNRIQVTFTPDPNQELPEYTVLASTDKVYLDSNVTYNMGFYHRKAIYVSPDGLPNNTGSKEYPFDIYTAVNNATPGQTIILLEGTYKLRETVRIQRGMDGTAEEPIRMIADPEAKTRPVLDFQGLCAGIIHGGDYWYFAGFDVTNSQATQKGFQVSGNYNTLDQIHAYRNGNTGIQLSRYSGTDLTIADWPSYNLILNCTSYLNADPGEEDADGFAAKLTCGVGNVFDGCIAYNNADDGWDLYAKVETGSIGAVTIRNCVAYNNGLREDGTPGKGNGNGFKMGGDSLSGHHVLENSIAFNNKAKGIDSNSCPDIIVRNCVAYNNGSYNVAFYTNNAGNTDFEATGIISLKDSNCPFADSVSRGDNLKPKGSQDESKYMNKTNYFWYGTSASNASGAKLPENTFVSLTFSGSIARKADGSIDMQGFLQVSDKAPAGTGAKPADTPSQDMTTIPEDVEHTYADQWYKEDSLYHWHQCECGDKGDIAPHTFIWVVDQQPTEDTVGEKHQECSVCGNKKPSVDMYFGEVVEGQDPQPSQPEENDPSQPVDPQPSQPTQPGENPPSNTGLIIAIVVVLVAALGVAAFFIVKKAMKKEVPQPVPAEAPAEETPAEEPSAEEVPAQQDPAEAPEAPQDPAE